MAQYAFDRAISVAGTYVGANADKNISAGPFKYSTMDEPDDDMFSPRSCGVTGANINANLYTLFLISAKA